MVASGRLAFTLLQLLLGLTVLRPPSIQAQARLAPGPSPLFGHGQSRPSAALRWAEPDTTKHVHDTYWKEGAFIGGVLGVIAGAFVFHGLCQEDDSAEAKNCLGASVGGSLDRGSSPGGAGRADRRFI